ncbi:TrkH family potassium uptake protein [Roseibium aggregatum]|uniref:Trk system potassium uptake protein n=1 Tax=Roseibium aggregatum TaxID=187304 RepID=A0A926P3I3_9HYPH|nr:TrkH family potassium uptake protein [Roseibium aggregatum]MBD1545972.1 TrkH family potassium uptake protein [Roseibium aggregatum]
MTFDRLRFVLFLNGIFLCPLAALMLIPAMVDLADGNTADTINFLISAAVTGTTGLLLYIAFRRDNFDASDRRAGFMITVSAWVFIGLFGALPLLGGSKHIGITDSLFESVSALTTTGATVLSGLDVMPRGLLLWRSLLQWFGGIGIIVMAMIFLPALRVGGMQLFQMESSDIYGKPFPKMRHLLLAILVVYVNLTLACAIGLVFAGMPTFDALNHAMTTIATGGLSTKDASIAYYQSLPIEIVTEVFMIAGALPLASYAVFLVNRGRKVLIDQQVKGFLVVLAAAIAMCTAWNISQGMLPREALRLSAFNVTSILTDTGFATADFSAWGGFAVGLFFMLYLIGGCAGSTAGAIKIFRWQVLFLSIRRSLAQMLYPNAVIAVHYEGKSLDEEVTTNVRNFFFLYMITLFALSMVLMATGLDFLSATSSIAQAMANAGPGLGPLVGPGTNFEAVPAATKWIVMAAMILGRLELLTFYVMLLPAFWKR